jgi:GNAT superfamily N-acetyltransferase
VSPVTIRPAQGAALDTYIGIKNAVTPDWPADREDIEWADRTYPGGVRLVADLDGRPVGAANSGRIYEMPADYPYWWAEIAVLEDARRRGVGSALFRAVCAAASLAGKRGLILPTWESRPAGAPFLRRHGYEEHERSKSVRLDLRRRDLPDVRLPDGVALTTLAARPDLLPELHAVASATFGDIPGGDPMAAGDLEEFRARDIDRPGIARDGIQVALDGDRVVGYASIHVEAGRPSIGIHDMTAVLAAHRGRGIATALKAATIRWAAERGLEALETGNDESNSAMRAVNARLGYEPLPDVVFFRGR